jgi:hypothetical protein
MCNALIRGRRGEGNGRHGPNASRPQSLRRRRWECSMVSRKEKRRNEGSGYSAAISKGATARVCRPCLSGTRMDSEGLTREQEDLEVRGGFGIANPFGSIILSQESTTSSSTFLSSIAKQDHKLPRELPLRPSSTHYNHSRQTPSSFTESRRRQTFLFADPVRHGSSLFTRSSP